MTPSVSTATSGRGDIVRGVVAFGVLAVLLVGTPLALSRLGWPLPRHLPTAADLRTALTTPSLTDDVIVNIAAVVCWVAWLLLSGSVIIETLAWARGTGATHLRLVGPLQPVVTRLVAAVIFALPASPRLSSAPRPLAAHPTAVTAIPRPAAAAAESAAPSHLGDAAAWTTASVTSVGVAQSPPAERRPSPVPESEYVVEPGDSLWSIAQRRLGNPRRFPEIWQHNAGRPEGSSVFRDPNTIHRGWHLTLPDEADNPAAAPPSAPNGTASNAEPTGSVGTPAPPPSPHASVADPALRPVPPTGTPAEPPQPVQASGPPAAMVPTAIPPAAPQPSSPVIPPAPPEPESTPTAPGATTAPTTLTPVPSVSPPAAPGTRPAAACSSSPANHAAPTAPTPAGRPRRSPPGIIEVGPGSVVGISVASGIAAALTVARRRRGRLRRPGTPQAGITYHDPTIGTATRRVLGQRPTPDGHTPETAPAPNEAPTAISIAERDGHDVTIDPAALGGLQLTGPGAAAAGRALLVSFLTQGGPDIAQARVVTPAYERLTGGIEPFPGLEPVETLDELLRHAEVELIRRARLLADEELDDLAAHRHHHPDEPLPALLLVIDDVPASRAERLRIILTVGGRLGLLGMILDQAFDELPTIEIDAAATLAAASPTPVSNALQDSRLYSLGAAEAAELLGVLADARRDDIGDIPPPPVVSEPFDIDPTPAALIRVDLFGSYSILAGGDEVRTGLRSKARELLAFFLLHPQGATLEAAVEALWPEAEPGRGPEWFWSALGNLRSRLRDATGQSDLKIIRRVGHTYRVDAELFDIDLWRFQAALTTASRTTDQHDVVDALQQAVDDYHGDFLTGSYFEWADTPREDLRRRAVDAASRLSELKATSGDLQGAIAALERAIAADPYTEDLYRRLMDLHGQHGRPDAIRHTFARLEARLAELDVEPERATIEVRDRLLERYRRQPPAA